MSPLSPPESHAQRRHLQMVLLAVAASCSGCGSGPGHQPVTKAREVMGTLATVTAVAPTRAIAAAAVEAGYRRLDDVNRLMSDYVDDSEVGRLNRAPAGAPIEVSPETLACVRAAIRVGRASGGVFDVTCRPLVSLWKQCGAERRLPGPEALEAARTLVGYEAIIVDESRRTLALAAEGMQLDLGGIAKGYALDLAAEAMVAAGATSVLVDVGGDVRVIGRPVGGGAWRVGVKHPFDSGLIRQLLLVDCAVATSGVQQRFYEIDGKRYSHIVDPRTGWPVEQAPSVTVIASDGLTADAWATAFSVLSVAEGQALLARQGAPDVEVLWISGSTAKPIVTTTPGFHRYLANP